MSLVLGLDIGTTSTIGILLELPDRIVATVSRPVTLASPHPGWAEEDPRQWWDNVTEITREILAVSGIKADAIDAIGVTGMLPALVLLDTEGHVLRPSIQQSDGRSGQEVAEMKAQLDEAAFLKKAGNGINQQLIATKLRWIRRHEPHVFSRIATVFGSYDYINWRLTGERAIEQNWALEGGFVDVARDELDDGLIALTGLAREAIPPKAISHWVLGHVTAEAAKATGLTEGTPVAGGAADLIASALGAGITKKGDVLLKFGGSVDILIATDKVVPDARMFLDYHLVPGLYMPNGCMSTGGSGLNWFAKSFCGGLDATAQAKGLSIHQYLDTLAAKIPAGAEGLTILPYFLGEKTPIHDPAARGVFDGLTLSHGPAHVWRALLEAYAYALRHHVEVLNDMGHAMTNFIVSDGGSDSALWMQIVADVLQQPVQRLTGHPGSCIGAAWTAAIAAELTDDWSGINRFVSNAGQLAPQPGQRRVYEDGYRRFRDLYERLKDRPATGAQ
ncbi:MAG: FGGY-family carbohydrate kinase [Aestuariivirga sp.]|uniref:FGGY-family carbohydrate kinase n=1 Tax=Aestuariivirga sp. TaxID=2650926 RepID=UPI00301AE873